MEKKGVLCMSLKTHSSKILNGGIDFFIVLYNY